MKMPLYTGGADQNRIKETLSLEDKARNDLEAARRGVAQGTRVAFLGLKSGRAQVNALEALSRRASSRWSHPTGLQGRRARQTSTCSMRRPSSILTQRDLARSRYDVVVNGLQLRQAAGELRPDDVNSGQRAVGALSDSAQYAR